MYEVWMIRKPDGKGGYSYYAYMSGYAPEFIANKELAKHFKTEKKAQAAFKEVGIYVVGSEVVKTTVQTL